MQKWTTPKERQQHIFTNPTEYKRVTLSWDSFQEYFFSFRSIHHLFWLALALSVYHQPVERWVVRSDLATYKFFFPLRCVCACICVCVPACICFLSISFHSDKNQYAAESLAIRVHTLTQILTPHTFMLCVYLLKLLVVAITSIKNDVVDVIYV